jgi:hypothetical protein
MRTHLELGHVSLSGRSVLVVGTAERGKRRLAVLRNGLVLLDVVTGAGKVNLEHFRGRAQLSELGFQLLLATGVTGGCAGGHARALFVHGKLLLVALQLLPEVLETLLQMLLAGLCPNEQLTRPAEVLVLGYSSDSRAGKVWR